MSRIAITIVAAGSALLVAACSSSAAGTKPPPTSKAHPAAASSAASAPASPAAPAAVGLTGKWSGNYSGSYAGTFILNWHQSGSNLIGKINLSNPVSTLNIHGILNGSNITFGTVGSLAITYAGTVSGNSMSGTYQVNGSPGGPWSGSRA